MSLGRGDLVFSAGTHLVTPFLDRLEPAAESGYAGVSVYPYEIDQLRQAGMTDAQIRHRVSELGLWIGEVDAITSWIPGSTPPPTIPEPLATALLGGTPEKLCPVAESIGARSLTVVEFFGTAPSVDQATEAFAAACDVASRHGLLLHLEFLPWAGIPDLMAAWRIVEGADRPNGGLLVDSWHFFRSGSSLDQLRRIPGDKLLYTQINDAPTKAEDDLAEETQHRRLLPGDGAFDLIGFVQALDGAGYTGPYGVEVFSDELNRLPIGVVTRRSADATRAVLAEGREPRSD
jgi:sugar phosphate isomerase/epimerase